MFVELITTFFRFENSLFLAKRIKEFVLVRDYQVPEQKKFSIAVYRLKKMSYINRNESVFKVLKACVNEIEKYPRET